MPIPRRQCIPGLQARQDLHGVRFVARGGQAVLARTAPQPLQMFGAFALAAFLNTLLATSLTVTVYAWLLRAAPGRRFKLFADQRAAMARDDLEALRVRMVFDQSMRGLEEGAAIGAGVALTRNLANLPGNVCTPTHLANTAKDLARRSGMTLGEWLSTITKAMSGRRARPICRWPK